MDIKQLQKIIFDYFKDTDDATLVEIVDSFVYEQTNPSHEASKLIENFLKDNGLEKAFLNYHYDKKEAKYWRRSNPSETSMIENVKMSLLGLSFNRFRVVATTLKYKEEIGVLDKKIKAQDDKMISIKTKANIKTFALIKTTLLSCYATLNSNEQYFYGEKEDTEFVEKVNKLELL